MPTVSWHLAQMKAAGIVATQRRGNQIFYRLLLSSLIDAFDCIERVPDAQPQPLAKAG